MKLCLLICVAIVGASAYSVRKAVSEKEGQCPESSGLAGICIFIPGVNCLSDSECASDLKCCSEGCGKQCKKPVALATAHAGSCPKPSGMAGICMILPNSCSGDDSCASDEKCCPEGCNLVCKKAI
ncbi:WAP four-disulfide core domain protein 18-like [Pomacea canaliculata]|uniref:WAP four-disulfide core domain protein 18-like n=1 Tax=Pomacea canaliculata TaxID=400727 RepID=UPI000D732A2F|nr:WAP four-disulfide core domain protein 18-like [Pomacea canaliculata]